MNPLWKPKPSLVLLAAHVTVDGPLDRAQTGSLASILVLSLCFGRDVTCGIVES
jgi:hypothetical protein